MADGSKIESTKVVSNLDCNQTFFNLMDPKIL
jgi:hypothetical protein